jgi:hypothetical protein
VSVPIQAIGMGDMLERLGLDIADPSVPTSQAGTGSAVQFHRCAVLVCLGDFE